VKEDSLSTHIHTLHVKEHLITLEIHVGGTELNDTEESLFVFFTASNAKRKDQRERVILVKGWKTFSSSWGGGEESDEQVRKIG